MDIEKAIFNRARLLMGDEAMDILADKRVIIFGVGGVGSWLAEALIRTGIRHLTIVDSDRVCITNINRQLMATTRSIGMIKVEALKERLLDINPKAEIDARQEIFCAESAYTFHLDEYDCIVDCIDSLKDKTLLIEQATRTSAKFYSSMGAALKIDPTRVKVAEFWKVNGCPLARTLRKKFKRAKIFPAKKFLCVYSDEVLPNRGENASCGTSQCMCPKSEVKSGSKSETKETGRQDLANHEWCSSKAQINGSLMHITAIFGLTLAGLILKDFISQIYQDK